MAAEITDTDEAGLLERLTEMARGDSRRFVAIAGPPGSGKSTLAEAMLARLGQALPGRAGLLPMDGFHYDDGLLRGRGWLAQKGAPHTFDTGGLEATLGRLAAGDRPVAVPVFDRALEISRAGARIIPPEVRLVLVEGNYLLLDDPEWLPMRRHFDLSVFVSTDLAELRRRLLMRWRDLPQDEANRKVEENDLPNARLVLERSGGAGLVLRN